MIALAYEGEAGLEWAAILQAATSATIAALASGHVENQNSLLAEGAVK